MASKTNKYTIQAETKGFKKAEGQTKKLGGGMKSLAKSVGGVALAYFSTQGLISGLKAVIKLSGEQELAEKKLATAFRGNTTGLEAYARQLQQVTRFGDEVVMGVMTSISAFNKDEDAIKRLTKATLDLAEGTGMDLKSAGDLVSKSIGSSTNALSRYGIQVVGAVGSTERLDSMLGNISDKFEGQATASADTMTGAIEQMQNAMGDTGEVIGGLLSPAVVSFAKNTKRLFEEIAIDIELHNTSIDLSSSKYQTLSAVAKASQIELRMEILKTAIELEKHPTMVTKVYDTWKQSMVTGSETALQTLAPTLSRVWELVGFLNEKFEIGEQVTEKLDQSMTNLSVDEEKVGELTGELNTLMEELATVMEGVATSTDDAGGKIDDLGKKLEKTVNIGNIVASTFGNMFDVDTSGGDVVKKFILDLLTLMEGVVLASKAVNVAISSSFLGGLGLPAIIGALASLELAKAGVRAVKFHEGGLIGGGDNVPITAQGGEFVMQRSAVESIGVERLSAMNEGGGGGITLNISSPLIDDTIIDTIVPAIDRARREGLA